MHAGARARTHTHMHSWENALRVHRGIVHVGEAMGRDPGGWQLKWHDLGYLEPRLDR